MRDWGGWATSRPFFLGGQHWSAALHLIRIQCLRRAGCRAGWPSDSGALSGRPACDLREAAALGADAGSYSLSRSPQHLATAAVEQEQADYGPVPLIINANLEGDPGRVKRPCSGEGRRLGRRSPLASTAPASAGARSTQTEWIRL